MSTKRENALADIAMRLADRISDTVGSTDDGWCVVPGCDNEFTTTEHLLEHLVDRWNATGGTTRA